VREQRLRALVGRLAARLPEQVQADVEVASLLAEAGHELPLTLVRIGYRAARDEAGPGKLFDFSAATLADRWAAGGEAMQQALGQLQ
jgi:NTE family protein